MKTTLKALITLVMLTVGGATAFAQDLQHPFDSNKELAKLDASTFETTLEVGEEIVLDATFLKRVWIDEAKLVHARVEDNKLYLTARGEGKAAIRLIWSPEADELPGTERNVDGVPKSMFVVTIRATGDAQ